MTSHLYRAFEARQNRTRENIQARQRLYLPFVRPLARLYPGNGVTDLGCARGEWLELLRGEQIPAQGVDLEEAGLQAGRDLGLDVSKADPLEHVAALPADSQLAVRVSGVDRHQSLERLASMVQQALRVLCPGGVLILEAPGATAALSLAPQVRLGLPVLAFVPEYCGFARVKVLRFRPETSSAGQELTLAEVLAGADADHAIVAQKAFGPDLPEPSVLAELDDAFSSQDAASLQELARQFEQHWATRMESMNAALQSVRQMVLNVNERHSPVLDRLAALERRVHELSQPQPGEPRPSAARRAVRWMKAQAVALRGQGVAERSRRLVRKALRIGIGAPVRLVLRYPAPRRMAIAVARATGLEEAAHRWRARLSPRPAETLISSMSPSARRIHKALQSAVSHPNGKKRKF